MGSEKVWSWVGRIGIVIAAIWGGVQIYHSVYSPTTNLVAEIRPTRFVLPFSEFENGELAQRVRSPDAPDLAKHVVAITLADGLVSIKLTNDGDRTIQNIRVLAEGAVLYAREAPGNVKLVLASDEKGVLIDELRQGVSIQIYAWTRHGASYSSWDSVQKEFLISYPDGVAIQRIYLAGETAAWMARNATILNVLLFPAIILICFGVIFILRPVFANIRSRREPPEISPPKM